MKKHAVLFALAVMATAVALARPAPPPPPNSKKAPPPPAKKKAAAPQNDTTRTTPTGIGLTAEDMKLRDPFWPPNHVPDIPELVDTPPQNGTDKQKAETKILTDLSGGGSARQQKALKKLKITAIGGGAGKRVVKFDKIGVFEAGETVSVKYEGRVYKWLITFINDEGKIGLKPVTQ